MPTPATPPTRRAVLAGGTGLLSLALIRSAEAAAPEPMEAAVRDFVGEASMRRGRVKLAVPALVENGNSIGAHVSVESPMTALDHARLIAVCNQKNPQPNVPVFHLGPRSGRA